MSIYSVDFRYSSMSICHSFFFFHSSWGHSLLCIIRQQPKSASLHPIPSNENHDHSNLTLSPDQAAHARACAKYVC